MKPFLDGFDGVERAVAICAMAVWIVIPHSG